MLTREVGQKCHWLSVMLVPHSLTLRQRHEEKKVVLVYKGVDSKYVPDM